MNKLKMIKLFFLNRREYAFQVLANPIRAEIERRKRRHEKLTHLYDLLKELRNYTLMF